ncbi:hypothetical protein SLS63_006043 [Diaporthe eres]|uniref:Uncharacterized protein n=1 Tax=Diaporthe eres TaxID=83184 RepID=A0ABR1P8Y5_DIAER
MADAGPELLQVGLVKAHRAKLGRDKSPAGPQLARDGSHSRVLRAWEVHHVRGEDHVDAARLDVLLGLWVDPGPDVLDCSEGAAFALVVAEYAVE